VKKWRVIAQIVAFAIFAVACLVHDFVRNDPIGCFSAKPHRLLYVAAIAIAGGLAALVFDRLSPRAQRCVRIYSWGAAASTLTAFVGYFAFRFASLSSIVALSDATGWVLVVLLLFSGMAAYLWFEFCQALKRKFHWISRGKR
jgi:hypothetical protein